VIAQAAVDIAAPQRAVWTVLADGGDLDALIADTSTATGLDTSVIRSDVDERLAALAVRGLVGPPTTP